MDNQNQTHFSLLLSSLGWILLVVISGFFLLFLKPQSYRQGLDDQYQTDLNRIDAVIGVDETAVDGVSGQVQRVVGDKIILNSQLQPQNPLRAAYPATREVVILDATKVTLRTLISEEEYSQRLAQASNQEGVLPFDETPGTIEDIVNGASILVIPASLENLVYAEQIPAAEIIVDVSTIVTTEPPAPPVAE